MNSRAAVLALPICQFLTSCGNGPWPPFGDQVPGYLERNIDTYLTFEREMTQDHQVLMHITVINGQRHTLDYQPDLTTEQKQKYQELFDGLEDQLNAVERVDNRFNYRIAAPAIRGVNGYARFIHGETWPGNVACAPESQNKNCGICSIELPNDWWFVYRWYKHGYSESTEDDSDVMCLAESQ
jgi:hypothetical protein